MEKLERFSYGFQSSAHSAILANDQLCVWQTTIVAMIDELVKKRPNSDGSHVSLQDLGYPFLSHCTEGYPLLT